jgi:hypothetical protein
MFWIPMAVGAGLGALSNKDNPLKGAAIGAGLGAGGGLLMPAAGAAAGGGLLGGTAATGLGAGTASAGLGAGTAMQGLSMGTAVPGLNAAAATPWWQGAQGLLSSAKPYMEAAGQGMQVANMFQDDEQPFQITPSPINPPTFNNAGGQMVAQMQQDQAQRMMQEKQNRLQRRQMRGGLL